MRREEEGGKRREGKQKKKFLGIVPFHRKYLVQNNRTHQDPLES